MARAHRAESRQVRRAVHHHDDGQHGRRHDRRERRPAEAARIGVTRLAVDEAGLMELETLASAPDHAGLDRIDLVANGTRITIRERPGHAIQIIITAPDGSRITDVTIWDGPPGALP